jgi:fucose permease
MVRSWSLRLGDVSELDCVTEIMGIPKTRTEANTHASANEQNKYKEIFSSRAIQLMALFIWVYVGAEVTIGGKLLYYTLNTQLKFLDHRMDCHCM